MNPKSTKFTPSCILKSLGVFLLLGLLVTSAFAQVNQPLTADQITGATPTTDLSMMMWRFILGDFADNPFSSFGAPKTLLGGMFIIFNAGIFSIGLIYLTYGIGSGLVGTAQDGQALGQRINSAWYPIRVITGISGLVPIFGGFTASQALIMSMGALGIGLANMLWSSAISPGTGSQNLINMGDPSYSVNSVLPDTARSIFLKHVCFSYLKKFEKISSEAGVMVASTDAVDVVEVANGYSAGSVNDPGMCGTLDVYQSAAIGNSVRTRNSLLGFRIDSVDYSSIGNNMSVIYKSAAKQLDADLKPVADNWIKANDAAAALKKNSPDVDYLRIESSYSKFQTTVNAGATSGVSGKTSTINAEAMQNMKVYGWLAAGAWFATFAEINSALSDAINATKVITQGPQYTSLSKFSSDTYTQVHKAAVAFDHARDQAGGVGMDKPMVESGCTIMGVYTGTGTATGNCSLGQAIVSRMIKFGSSGDAVSNNPQLAGLVLTNPIIVFKNGGDYIMSIASTIVGLDVALNVAEYFAPAPVVVATDAVAAEKSPDKPASGSSNKPWDFLKSIGLTMLLTGVYMSIYIPMIPFIIWMGAITGYAASFIEGLIAMPLHSFSHLNTDGEGMGQSTNHGYLFMLNTIARPSLMVLSFFFASALVIVLGTFTGALFLPAMANVQGNSITGIFSVLGFLFVYASINVTLINGCFELIHIIPDQVIGFVGSGNISTRMGSDAERNISGAYAKIGGGAKGHVDGGMQGIDAAKKAKDDAAYRAEKLAQK